MLLMTVSTPWMSLTRLYASLRFVTRTVHPVRITSFSLRVNEMKSYVVRYGIIASSCRTFSYKPGVDRFVRPHVEKLPRRIPGRKRRNVQRLDILQLDLVVLDL